MKTKNQEKTGSVKIGRSGTKLHPARIDEQYGLIITCSCPGTQQGSALNKSKFFINISANCRT
jgi:hypothetical protein